jgi:hypothetical protein
MRHKWTIDQIEHAPYEITEAKEKQLIAELAEVMYIYFCQLQKNSPKSICSHDSSEREEERTGRKYA